MIAGFFRHGPAAPRGSSGVRETERPLTREGRRKTIRAAKGLRRLNLGFDAVFTSPLIRALETAEILAQVLELPAPKAIDLLRPGTAGRRLLAELPRLGSELPLLVGHEPMLSSAAALSVGGTHSGGIQLKKSGMALVRVDPTASALKATLLLLLTPAVLRKLGS